MSYEKYDQDYIELLTSLGFVEYDPNNENHWNPEIDLHEGEILFIEEDRVRQRIYVVLWEMDNDEEDSQWQVYVLDDIGCGSILMPFNWIYMQSDWLTALKQSLQLTNFKKGGEYL